MREILFKAKGIYSRKWYEGILVEINEKSCYIKERGGSQRRECDSATICQYTGLTDKNGAKIWENDIVEESVEGIGVVAYKKCEFIISWITGTYRLPDLWFWANERDIEVVGNVFDNPELLKGGAE